MRFLVVGAGALGGYFGGRLLMTYVHLKAYEVQRASEAA